MHAKISDKTERVLRPRVSDCQALALAEARAILAETEDGRRYATLAYLRLSRMPANVVACDAIVDALRSFVEA